MYVAKENLYKPKLFIELQEALYSLFALSYSLGARLQALNGDAKDQLQILRQKTSSEECYTIKRKPKWISKYHCIQLLAILPSLMSWWTLKTPEPYLWYTRCPVQLNKTTA